MVVAVFMFFFVCDQGDMIDQFAKQYVGKLEDLNRALMKSYGMSMFLKIALCNAILS